MHYLQHHTYQGGPFYLSNYGSVSLSVWQIKLIKRGKGFGISSTIGGNLCSFGFLPLIYS